MAGISNTGYSDEDLADIEEIISRTSQSGMYQVHAYIRTSSSVLAEFVTVLFFQIAFMFRLYVSFV